MSIAEKLQTIAENEQRVFDSGKKKAWNDFWDIFQQNGNRTYYTGAFASDWNDETFKPKYNINVVEGNRMFYRSKITNLKQILIDCGVVLDFSNATVLSEMFMHNAFVTHLPTIDTRACASFSYMVCNASKLVEIEKLILKDDGSQSYAYAFDNLWQLKNIVIEGQFGNNVSFLQSSFLTHDSLVSIINALKDYSGTTTTRKLILHESSKAKLTEEDVALANGKGWTIA